MSVRILVGDCRVRLSQLPDESVNCIVTSPPYFGLRNYDVEGQIGLEPTPEDFVAELVSVFRECRRVLRADGTLWLNLGDSYSAHPGQRKTTDKVGAKQATNAGSGTAPSRHVEGLKAKDLIGIPWRVAFALQSDGWWLRQDIIWSKPNPMPESVTDRCTKAHEYLFLMTKSERYHFDAQAIAEAAVADHVPGNKSHKGVDAFASGDEKHRTKSGLVAYSASVSEKRKALRSDIESRHRSSITGGQSLQAEPNGTRNKRSVWTVATQPFSEAHFATFPSALIEPCILAGCPEDGIVLDPFGGAGTTGLVADRLGRNAILVELNSSYAEMAKGRIQQDGGMMSSVVLE